METPRPIDSIREGRRLALERLPIDPATGLTVLTEDCDAHSLNALLRGRISDLVAAMAEARTELDHGKPGLAAEILEIAVPAGSVRARDASSLPELTTSAADAFEWDLVKEGRRLDLEALAREGKTGLGDGKVLNALLRDHLMDLEDAIQACEIRLERGSWRDASELLDKAGPTSRGPPTDTPSGHAQRI